jgi:hypothetical protein
MGKSYQCFFVVNSLENQADYFLLPNDFREKAPDDFLGVLGQMPEFDPDPALIERILQMAKDL